MHQYCYPRKAQSPYHWAEQVVAHRGQKHGQPLPSRLPRFSRYQSRYSFVQDRHLMRYPTQRSSDHSTGCCSIIAHNPILIEEDAIGGLHGSDSILPGQAAIGRAIDQHSCASGTTTLVQNGETGNQPDLVFGVISNSGVADTVIDALRAGVDGSTRKKTMLPGCSIIRGGGPTSVGTTAIGESSHLGGTDDG